MTTIEDPHSDGIKGADGRWFYGLHILSGRIKDVLGLGDENRACARSREIHTGDFRLTPSQNVSIAGVTTEQKPKIEAILAKHGLKRRKQAIGPAPQRALLRCPANLRSGSWPKVNAPFLRILEKFEVILDEAGLAR